MMLIRSLLVMMLVSAVVGLDMRMAVAADDKAGEKKKAALIAYQPPLRGAPLSRVGGGTRSMQADDLAIEVLAPEHAGLTLQTQPVLYWYCSRAITVPVEFTIVIPEVPEPIAEITLKGPFEPGIHAVDLQQLGVSLKEETDYEWFVSVVFDSAQRSNDVTAGGAIRQIGAADPLRGELNGRGTLQGADYAQAGVWYDAIAALSTRTADQSGDPTPGLQRAELLRQVGLEEAAAAITP